jgi:hypothetical protein
MRNVQCELLESTRFVMVWFPPRRLVASFAQRPEGGTTNVERFITNEEGFQ